MIMGRKARFFLFGAILLVAVYGSFQLIKYRRNMQYEAIEVVRPTAAGRGFKIIDTTIINEKKRVVEVRYGDETITCTRRVQSGVASEFFACVPSDGGVE